MKTIDMEEAFATMPELPTRFEEYCYNQIQRAPIYYKRKGKTAECLCGICGMGFSTNEIPMRKGIAKCPICGGTGVWEWMRCTIPKYTEEDIILIQCTTDRNLVEISGSGIKRSTATYQEILMGILKKQKKEKDIEYMIQGTELMLMTLKEIKAVREDGEKLSEL